MKKKHNQAAFTSNLLQWAKENGRKDLPWQQAKTPYKVWISEIMLQQTQVKTVIPYFERFMRSFPTIQALASSDEDDVLAHWSGLGYYSRARNLHKAAKIIDKDYNGQCPNSLEEWIKLPGVGQTTAAAILSLALNQSTAILDGNVKRVLCRYFLISGDPSRGPVEKILWETAQKCMPKASCSDYTQAIMDFGALCCTPKNPDCQSCPIQSTCQAYQTQSVEQFPQKKRSRPKPTKELKFLLLFSKPDLIYLEKNPSHGIWGRLWSLPSIEINECPVKHTEHHYLSSIKNIYPLKEVKHSFTHFNLKLHPVAIEVSNTPRQKLPGKWTPFKNRSEIGLSKPIRDIINSFGTMQNIERDLLEF